MCKYFIMETHLHLKYLNVQQKYMTQQWMWLDNWTNQQTNLISNVGWSFWNAWAKVCHQNDLV